MGVTGFISAIIVGAIIGALGRLVLPGKQPIPIWLTIVIGIVAAMIGMAIASSFTTSTIITIVIQVILAALGVAAVVSIRGRGTRV